jgi:hypothetical protein
LTINAQTITLALVVVHIVVQALHHVIKAPARQAQLDRIDRAVSDVGGQLTRGA